jgi:NAD(P)-dependent dehydrogenase (short-subunit alcohol dehydrogenase family)
MRNVIVTGAGSGIGAAIAAQFVESGDRVFLADLSQPRLDDVVTSLASPYATAHHLDVTDAEAAAKLVAHVVDEAGSVDVLVSNAGVFDGCAGIAQTSTALWAKVIGINLTGTFNIVKPVAEAMVAQRRGRIVAIGSIAGQRALPDGLAYSTSKAGLEGLIRRVAFDLGGHGITANVVAPGAIATNIRANSEEILGDLVPDVNVGVGANPDLIDMIIPAKRRGEASEIAATVHFLASDGAAYINGDVIHVDGGWYAS